MSKTRLNGDKRDVLILAARAMAYQKEIVTRCAPRWAWAEIDDTLLECVEFGDPSLRVDRQAALDAMDGGLK